MVEWPGLRGKRALITGHKRGIGAATLELLSSCGVTVVGLDLPEVDLAHYEKIPQVVASALASIGGSVDILINNAGVNLVGSILEMTLEELEYVMAVNLKAPMLLMKAVLPNMIAQGHGVIINNTSDQALVGKTRSAAYGSSKAALAHLTKSAALDFVKHGIRINAVAPGSTDTQMLREVFTSLHARYPDEFPPANPAFDDFYAKAIPMQRFAQPREIAAVIAFLASDAASFITGTVVGADGGYTAG